MNYSASHQTPVGTNLTIIHLMGTAAIQARIFQILISSDATPEDSATEFTIARTTSAVSGGTSLTEAPLMPLSVAATAIATGGTYTGEFTYGNILLMLALNQRSYFQWTASIPGRELVVSAVADNGIGVRSVASGGTFNTNATIQWFE